MVRALFGLKHIASRPGDMRLDPRELAARGGRVP